jgi:ActR/RegA family two-component response regulator
MNATVTNSHRQTLLSIVELGGYPDFRTLYEKTGYTVKSVPSVRKALALMKTLRPRVIVAEFNFQSDFRDRTSTLESLLAVVQTLPDVRVIVFYENEFAHQLARVTARFPIHAALEFPVDEERLLAALQPAG